jgi:hypothetical protein
MRASLPPNHIPSSFILKQNNSGLLEWQFQGVEDIVTSFQWSLQVFLPCIELARQLLLSSIFQKIPIIFCINTATGWVAKVQCILTCSVSLLKSHCLFHICCTGSLAKNRTWNALFKSYIISKEQGKKRNDASSSISLVMSNAQSLLNTKWSKKENSYYLVVLRFEVNVTDCVFLYQIPKNYL